MMWTFRDKGDRDVCLVPEITGIFQEQFRENPEPRNVFYVSKCFRYERPQKGRYREFTQVGLEMLGTYDVDQCVDIMEGCLSLFDADYTIDRSAKRGLSYYVGEGFEAKVESLGAQKQVAGGGVYPEGVGFAIGLDRMILAESL